MVNSTKAEMITEDDVCLTFTCPFCGAETKITVPVEKYMEYLDGGLAQNVFPTLSADDREVLISGICKKCQDEVFN